MLLLITVRTPLQEYQFDLETKLNMELPYEDFVTKLKLKEKLDKKYPGWTSFEIDLYEIPDPEWKKEEKQNVEEVVAQFGSN